MSTTLHTLSSKSDRSKMSNETLQQSFAEYSELTPTELQHAKKDLSVYYRQRETVYADPPYKNQSFCLFSWVPSENARPDENGVYGMMKFRGAFDSEDDMNARAEFLVTHCDSFHRIYHAPIGRPLPITLNEEYVRDIKFAKQSPTDDDVIHTSIQKDKENEANVQRELHERMKIIKQEETSPPTADPLDEYIQHKVKIAFNMAAIDNFMRQVEKAKQVIQAAHDAIQTMDLEHPTFSSQFIDKYNETRSSVGIDTVHERDEGMDAIRNMRHTPADVERYLRM
jgi:hypothetical protein